jgi:hypothetical protein
LTAAINNTLSRDGTTPNQMNATLDMNNNQIINLPAPNTVNSPARLIDITNPVAVPNSILGGNNIFTGTNTFSGAVSLPATVSGTTAFTGPISLGTTVNGSSTFTGDQYFKSGAPWYDVKAFGAVGHGATNDTAAIQAAINAAQAFAFTLGGIVYFPPGIYNVQGGLTVNGPVHLLGSGMDSTIIQSFNTDVIVINTSGAKTFLENFTIYGKGISPSGFDLGTFGATNPALVIGSSSGVIRCVSVIGGSNSILINGSDNLFEQVFTNQSYGNCCVNTGANWFVRCAFDYSTTGVAATSSFPFANWAATTSYTVGQIVVNGSAAIQCLTAGTSGGSAPTNKNIGVNITDGSVVWQFFCPASFSLFQLVGSGLLENHMLQCDFSGFGAASSITQNSSSGVTGITDSVFSAGIVLSSANWFSLEGCECAGAYTINSGKFSMSNCAAVVGSIALTVGANVNNFIVSNNFFSGGTITVTTGTSDHYTITNNVGVTVTDGGSGTHKTITGNVA